MLDSIWDKSYIKKEIKQFLVIILKLAKMTYAKMVAQ